MLLSKLTRICLILLLLILAGCGQSGPLYLPTTPVAHPANNTDF